MSHSRWHLSRWMVGSLVGLALCGPIGCAAPVVSSMLQPVQRALNNESPAHTCPFLEMDLCDARMASGYGLALLHW
jgi:hypothetical protein